MWPGTGWEREREEFKMEKNVSLPWIPCDFPFFLFSRNLFHWTSLHFWIFLCFALRKMREKKCLKSDRSNWQTTTKWEMQSTPPYVGSGQSLQNHSSFLCLSLCLSANQRNGNFKVKEWKKEKQFRENGFQVCVVLAIHRGNWLFFSLFRLHQDEQFTVFVDCCFQFSINRWVCLCLPRNWMVFAWRVAVASSTHSFICAGCSEWAHSTHIHTIKHRSTEINTTSKWSGNVYFLSPERARVTICNAWCVMLMVVCVLCVCTGRQQ